MRVIASIRHIFENSFGLIISQIINLAFIPILARTYTASEFGVFSLYFTISIVLSGIASAKYQDAISTAKTEKEAFNITKISILLALIFTTLATPLLVTLFKSLYQSPEIGFMCALSTLGLAFCSIGIQIAIKDERTKIYSIIIVLMSGLTPVLQLLVHDKAIHGLILGGVLSHSIAAIVAVFVFQKGVFQLLNYSPVTLATMRKYQSFPKFSLPNFLFLNLRIRLLYFLAPSFSSSAFLGFYSQVDRIVTAPSSLSAVAMKPLISKILREKTASSGQIFQIAILGQWVILSPLLSIFISDAGWIVKLIFGDKWTDATSIFQIMIVPGFFMMTTNWLDRILDFNRIHRKVLWLEVTFLILATGGVLAAGILLSPFTALIIFCGCIGLYYVLWLQVLATSLKIKKGFIPQVFLLFSLILGLSLGANYYLQPFFHPVTRALLLLLASCVITLLLIKVRDLSTREQ